MSSLAIMQGINKPTEQTEFDVLLSTAIFQNNLGNNNMREEMRNAINPLLICGVLI